MDESSKLLLTMAIPTVSVLIGILINNRQLDALRGEMIARFEAQTQGLLQVEQVLDARLKHLEERARR